MASIPACRSMERRIVIAIRWPSIRLVSTAFAEVPTFAIPGMTPPAVRPNLERTFASLPGYFYSTSKDGLYVHLYDNSVLDWHLENGTPLKIQQKTRYPWDGEVKLTVAPAQPTDFTLYVRIPGWAQQASVRVNGKAVAGVNAGQYLPIKRQWKSGDTVSLNFEMIPEIVASNPRVAEDMGRVAVQRGPVIYCMEQMDQPDNSALSDLSIAIRQGSGNNFQSEYKADLLDGVEVLHHSGAAYEVSSAEEALYSPANLGVRKTRAESLTLIPYYAWANRQPTPMQVWTPYTRG